MTLEGSMENSNGSIVDYSSEIETLKKAKQPIESGYSSMEEDTDCKVEIVESVYAVSERSEDDWIKPKIERKLTIQTPDKKHICGRISVAGISSPGRNHLSDGGASSSDVSPGASSPSRSCTQCGATKTPLWRNGPSGPKSLCNACGIRYKKVGGSRRTTATDPHESSSHHSGKSSSKSPKRKAELDSGPSTHRRSKQQSREKREAAEDSNNNGTSSSSRGPNHQPPQPQPQQQQQSPGITSNIPRRVCTRRTLPAFNTQKWGSRSARFNSSTFRKSQSKDEEEGAALLMALACGLVNA